MALPNFVTDPKLFKDLYARACAAVDNLDSNNEYGLMFFEDSDFFREGSFEYILKLLNLTGANSFCYMVLKPDPIRYFFHHFKKYPAMIFTTGHTAEDYGWGLMQDPGNPADAISVNNERYVIQPIGADWLMFGNAWTELSVLKFPKALLAEAKAQFPFRIIEDVSLADVLEEGPP